MKFSTSINLIAMFAIARDIGLAALLLLFFSTVYAQDKAPWRNKKCAVALTYDDALNVHLDKVIPVLDSLGFKGTFYLAGYFPGFGSRMNDWKAIAKKGHELGNHSLFHPCNGTVPGRDWVMPDYDLSKYTVRRVVDEIRMNNLLLEALDDKTARTFAYPCGEMNASDGSYVDSIKGDFAGARGVGMALKKINEIDLFNINCFMANGQSGNELIALVKQAIAENALLVFLFHGVGGEHNINEPLADHNKLLSFLKQNEKDIWVAPLVEIAEYVRDKNKSVKAKN